MSKTETKNLAMTFTITAKSEKWTEEVCDLDHFQIIIPASTSYWGKPLRIDLY